jgi:hypothetical protein
MSDQVSVALPDENALIGPAEELFNEVRAIVVLDDGMYAFAADELKRVKAAVKKLTDERMGITRDLDSAKRKIMDRYAKPVGFLEQAEAAIKRAMLTFTDKREQERRVAEAAARETARKESEKLAAQAEKAAAAGKVEKAAVLQQAAEAAAVSAPVLPAAAKAEGTHTRLNYRAEVADVMELVKFVAANPRFINLIEPNMSALNAQATALKEAFEFPGCKLAVTKTLVSR